VNLTFILFLFDRYAAGNVPSEEQINNAWVDFNKGLKITDLDRG
jgi:hypothetical protein